MTTSNKKVGEGTSDEFILLALPKEEGFSDGSPLKIISGLGLEEALNTLRNLRGAKDQDNGLSEAGNVMLIKGAIQPILEDFTAVKVDDTEYSIKDPDTKFVQSFVNVVH